MKRALLISTIFIILLIAIGCASAANVDDNSDGKVDGTVLDNATFHDNGTHMGGDAVIPDDSAIVDNKTVPDGSDVIDNDTYDDSLQPGDDSFYIDNETIFPDGSDVIDNGTVPNHSGAVDNKTVPENGGDKNHNSKNSIIEILPCGFEDIIGYDQDLHINNSDVVNLNFHITNLDFSDSVIDAINYIDSFINIEDIVFNIDNLREQVPQLVFFNFNDTHSGSINVPDYMGCPNYNLSQSPMFDGKFLFLGY